MSGPFLSLVFLNTLLMVVAYIYLYYQYRERFLGCWAVAGVLYLMEYCNDLLFIVPGKEFLDLPVAFQFIDLMCLITGGFLLLQGITSFVGKSPARWWAYAYLGAVLLAIANTIFQIQSPLVSLPVRFLLGCGTSWAGFILMSYRKISGLGKYLTGFVLMLWGLMNIAFAFHTPVNETTQWAYLAVAVIGAFSVMGVLLIYIKKNRHELSESEKRFRLLTENARDIIYRITLTPQFAFDYISPAVETIIGYAPSEFYRRPALFLEITHPEDRSALTAYLKTGVTVNASLVFRMIHQNQSIVWLEQKNVPLRKENGEIYAYEGIARDITENKIIEKRLEYLSRHDALTGLGNRFSFEEQMSQTEQNPTGPVGIVVCDIDGLKVINDSLGHDYGDLVIKEAGNIIRNSFRESDSVTRIGGDEFAVILRDCPREIVEKSCNRLRKALVKHNSQKPELPIRISIGFSYSSLCELNMKELFKEADNRMYQEKLEQGKIAHLAIINALLKAITPR